VLDPVVVAAVVEAVAAPLAVAVDIATGEAVVGLVLGSAGSSIAPVPTCPFPRVPGAGCVVCAKTGAAAIDTIVARARTSFISRQRIVSAPVPSRPRRPSFRAYLDPLTD